MLMRRRTNKIARLYRVTQLPAARAQLDCGLLCQTLDRRTDGETTGSVMPVFFFPCSRPKYAFARTATIALATALPVTSTNDPPTWSKLIPGRNQRTNPCR